MLYLYAVIMKNKTKENKRKQNWWRSWEVAGWGQHRTDRRGKLWERPISSSGRLSAEMMMMMKEKQVVPSPLIAIRVGKKEEEFFQKVRYEQNSLSLPHLG
jgi:hypothetical protein